MIAVTACGSALHCAAGEPSGLGDLRTQRKAELGVVLGSVGLGWLHTPLVEAGVRSLARLRSLSVEQLLSKLEGTCRQRAAIGPVRQKLGCLGLQRPSGDAPLPPQGMMRD